jgi:hypothetical protein
MANFSAKDGGIIRVFKKKLSRIKLIMVGMNKTKNEKK